MEGWRKFVLSMTLGVGCLLLCAFGRLSGGETVTVVSILSALYKAANVAAARWKGTPP